MSQKVTNYRKGLCNHPIKRYAGLRHTTLPCDRHEGHHGKCYPSSAAYCNALSREGRNYRYDFRIGDEITSKQMRVGDIILTSTGKVSRVDGYCINGPTYDLLDLTGGGWFGFDSGTWVYLGFMSHGDWDKWIRGIRNGSIDLSFTKRRIGISYMKRMEIGYKER